MEVLRTINPALLSLSQEQWNALLPYAWVFLGTTLAILASVTRLIHPKWPVFVITIASCLVGICSSWQLMSEGTVHLFNNTMVSDAYSQFFNIIFLGAAAFTTLASFRYLDKENLQHPEYYVMILFSALGMMLMASSLDLIVIFIALELMSLSVYVLVGFRRVDRRSNEAAMKYFILGSVASAILLYGAALLYGSTATTEVRAMISAVKANPAVVNPVFVLGTGLVLVGLLFKVAFSPVVIKPVTGAGAPS